MISVFWNGIYINPSEGITPDYLEYLKWVSSQETQEVETVEGEIE